MNGLSKKHQVVDQTIITGTSNMVKSAPNGITSEVSLLEAIAFDHYNKCTTLPTNNAESSTINGGSFPNPLSGLTLTNRTVRLNLKENNFPASASTAVNMNINEKPTSPAINNPLMMATGNPLLAMKASTTGQKPNLISNSFLGSADSIILNPSLKSDTNPLRGLCGGGVESFEREFKMDQSPTTLSRNPLFGGGVKPVGFSTNPLVPVQSPIISVPLLTSNVPVISPSNSLPDGVLLHQANYCLEI